MKDDPLKNCPECGGEIKRLIGTGLGPIFKGTGFYQTDYKNNSSNGGNNSSKNSKSVSESEKVKPAKKKGKNE
jgi:predicted nucleic acid-binding Zn ribbon protein